jgi:hypothetical protein
VKTKNQRFFKHIRQCRTPQERREHLKELDAFYARRREVKRKLDRLRLISDIAKKQDA